MVLMIISMINSLFISSSQNSHHEQTQQRVSDAKIGRFRSFASMLCSMPAEQKRKRPETFFFLLFFGASACTISSWLPRSEPKRDRFGDLCEKKTERKGRKKSFIQRKESVVTHAVAVCILLCSNVQMLENRTHTI